MGAATGPVLSALPSATIAPWTAVQGARMTAITDHAYGGSDAEFGDLLDLLAESYGISRWPHNWLIGRLYNWRYARSPSAVEADPGFPSRNAHLWRTTTGRLAGFCISEYGGVDMQLQVHPDCRRIEASMLRWTLEEWALNKERVQIEVYARDGERQALLAGVGFQDEGGGGFTREYDLSGDYPLLPLEAGFSIASLSEHPDLDGRVATEALTFGQPDLDRPWLEAKMSAPGYSFEWDLSVLSRAGQYVAFCLACPGWRNRVAEIDPVGAHPEFRRRGFAKALLGECFRRLRAAGIERAYIGSAPEPYHSNRLYESLRPVARYEAHSWVKRLA